MVSYTQREMVGITELAKSLGGFVEKVVSGSIEKLTVVRHNKAEVVILPIAEYERMKEITTIAEDMQIASIISQRDPDGKREGTFDFDTYHKKRLSKRDV